MRFRELDDLPALGTDGLVDLLWLCASEAIDPLSEVTGERRAPKPNAVHDTKLLKCQILELVNNNAPEMSPIQIRDGIIRKDQLRDSRKIVVRETTLRNPLALDLEGRFPARRREISVDLGIRPKLLLSFAQSDLYRSSGTKVESQRSALRANPVAGRQHQVRFKTDHVRMSAKNPRGQPMKVGY